MDKLAHNIVKKATSGRDKLFFLNERKVTNWINSSREVVLKNFESVSDIKIDERYSKAILIINSQDNMSMKDFYTTTLKINKELNLNDTNFMCADYRGDSSYQLLLMR